MQFTKKEDPLARLPVLKADDRVLIDHVVRILDRMDHVVRACQAPRVKIANNDLYKYVVII